MPQGHRKKSNKAFLKSGPSDRNLICLWHVAPVKIRVQQCFNIYWQLICSKNANLLILLTGWVFEGGQASDIWYLDVQYVVMWIFSLTLSSIESKFPSWIDLSPKSHHPSLNLTLILFFKLVQTHFNMSPREAIQKSESFKNQNLYSGYSHIFALLPQNR